VGVQGVVLDAHQQGPDDSKGYQSEQREHLAVLLQRPATHGPRVPQTQRLQTGVPATEAGEVHSPPNNTTTQSR